jgi:hypothetical protein
MTLGSFIYLFLVVSFVAHGVAFAVLAVKRRRTYYFFLTGTFIFLTAIYFIKFEGWQPAVPGTHFPVTWLLRLGATACTLIYLSIIYKEEGSWLWKLTRGRKR